MHPGINGPKFKDKPAVIMAGSGDVITHQELNELSNQGAQLFRSLGLKPCLLYTSPSPRDRG